MVKIQIDISKKLSRYLGIKKEVYQTKNKRETIVKILEEKLSKDKELMKILKINSVEV